MHGFLLKNKTGDTQEQSWFILISKVDLLFKFSTEFYFIDNIFLPGFDIYLPVHRCSNLLLCSELQRVNNPEQLVKVPPRGGRVEDGQLQLLVGADHKHLRGSGG